MYVLRAKTCDSGEVKHKKRRPPSLREAALLKIQVNLGLFVIRTIQYGNDRILYHWCISVCIKTQIHETS